MVHGGLLTFLGGHYACFKSYMVGGSILHCVGKIVALSVFLHNCSDIH